MSKIGIIGSGLIGRSWTMIFVSYGFDVHLYDVVPENVTNAMKLIKEQLDELEIQGLLRGQLNAAAQFGHVHRAKTLADAVSDAIHIQVCKNETIDFDLLTKMKCLLQECVFENLELKKQVFSEIDAICSNTVVLCSSTSCFLPSLITENLTHKSQFIVGHPVNPPYFVPLVEIVPSKWTDQDILKRTDDLYRLVGQKPVVLKREIEGFIVNRIQYAILNECYRLIEDDVISVTDVDSVMSDGLGMRYAFIGPWETAHLNAQGMEEYFAKYAQGINDVSRTMGPVPMMSGDTAKLIADQMNGIIPESKLPERRQWRDQRLIALSQLKKKMN